jgi:hypothetical protein
MAEGRRPGQSGRLADGHRLAARDRSFEPPHGAERAARLPSVLPPREGERGKLGVA